MEFLDLVVSTKRYEAAAMLAQETIPLLAGDTTVVGHMQALRAKALLSAHKAPEALEAAKGYYNVCALNETTDAINLVALCISIARPEEPGIARRFKAQQVANSGSTGSPQAAATQPAAPAASAGSGQADLGEPIMPTIKVDAAPYAKAIDDITLDGTAAMLAQGNLLLLADRTKEARVLMQRMNDVAEPRDMSMATEAVARAIRAEAGYVGPANKYIMEQRAAAGNP